MRSVPKREHKYSFSLSLESSMAVQAQLMFSNGDTKKRGREAQAQMPLSQNHHHSVFSLPSQPCLIGPSQLQAHHSVSTGLRLSSEDSDSFSEELFDCINRHNYELDRFLLAQGEELRRTLAEKRQQHYRALLAAAEESAASRMREKQAELDRAAKRAVELEERLGRLRTEALAWQAKAMREQAAAASLHAQLQRAESARERLKPDDFGAGNCSPVEDAESAHVDPDRFDRRAGLCRSCRVEPASIVLLPCRHLCLCLGCDAVTVGEPCPLCRSARSGSVQVFF